MGEQVRGYPKKGYVKKPEREMILQLGTLRSLRNKAYNLAPVPTGVPNLDKLFFYSKVEDGEVVTRLLGGFPKGAVINVAGSSDTGKSLMAQQFAVENAQESKVLFITTESPKEMLVSSLRRLCEVRGVPIQTVEGNIIIVDVSRNTSIDHRQLLKRLERLMAKARPEIMIIDSLTALFEDREMMARSVTRAIYQFSKANNLTTMLISQKREDSPFSAKAAGGLAIGHIVDCNILLSKIVISTPAERSIYGRDIGDVVRTLRIDGCRMCGHSSKTFIVEIDRTGILRVVGPLGKVKRGEKRA